MFSKPWFCTLLIIALGITCYSFMLQAPFKTSDDQVSIVANPLIQEPARLKEIFTTGYFKDKSYYRPLVNLSFRQEYQTHGLNPYHYYLHNLFLHILNAFLVWALVAIVTENATVGFWVALLFVVHPIHAEAVSNVSGRAIILSASFVLLAAITFIKSQECNNKILLGASAISFLLGLLCKESAGVLPMVMLAYLGFKKKSVIALWPFVVIIVGYILWRHHLGIVETFPWRGIGECLLGFTTFLRSLITDLRLLLLPVGLYFDRSQRLFGSFSDSELIGTLCIWSAIILWVTFRRHQLSRLSWFLIAWIILELLPVSQIITTIGVSPGRISSADHFLYLVSVPIFIIIVQGFRSMYKSNNYKNWISPFLFKFFIGVFIVFLMAMNIEQNIYASNELAMLKRSVEQQPLNARIQSALGYVYAKQGKLPEAQERFLWAVFTSPENVRYRISLAKSICDQGRYAECLKIYDEIKDPGAFAELLKDNVAKTKELLSKQHAEILPK